MFGPILLLLAMTGPQATDPLAPAREAKIQCYVPDTAKKTCQSLQYYEPKDGGYANRAVALVVPQPPITLETTSMVQIKNGQVCGSVTREVVMAGKLTMNGEAMPADQAKPILEQIVGSLEGMSLIGPELCTNYVTDGDTMKGEVTVDGKAMPALTQPVIWVSPSDGYKVAG